MTQDKIYVRTTKHKTKPIHIWHPSGKGESFEELSIDEARALIQDLEKASGIIYGVSFVSRDTAITELQDKLEELTKEIEELAPKADKSDEHYRAMREFQERNSNQAMQIRDLKKQIGEITTELSKHPREKTYYNMARVTEDYSILMANIQKILGVKDDGD